MNTTMSGRGLNDDEDDFMTRTISRRDITDGGPGVFNFRLISNILPVFTCEATAWHDVVARLRLTCSERSPTCIAHRSLAWMSLAASLLWGVGMNCIMSCIMEKVTISTEVLAQNTIYGYLNCVQKIRVSSAHSLKDSVENRTTDFFKASELS